MIIDGYLRLFSYICIMHMYSLSRLPQTSAPPLIPAFSHDSLPPFTSRSVLGQSLEDKESLSGRCANSELGRRVETYLGSLACEKTTEMAQDEEGKLEKATLEGDEVEDIENHYCGTGYETERDEELDRLPGRRQVGRGALAR